MSDALATSLPGAARTADLPKELPDVVRVFFRHGSPRILSVLLATALVARVAVAGFTPWDLVPAVVLVAFWPVQEWLIHVYVLHYQPRTILGRTLDFRVPRKHRAHHADPWQIDLLFIPQHTFLFTVPLLLLLWFGLMPTPALALSGLCAYLALALHYEWVHYLAHTRYVPRSARYQRLVKSHRWHHFKNEHYWYGVSMLGGDRLLGTQPGPDEVETSPTVHTLFAGSPRG